MSWFNGTLILTFLNGDIERIANISYAEAKQQVKKEKTNLETSLYIPDSIYIEV